MITPDMVGQDTFSKVEGSLRIQLHKLTRYDWWQAGIQAGCIPREWEVLQYGREHALTWILDGTAIDEAVNMGIKAMYRLAYGDVRDSIQRRGNLTFSATSATEVEATHIDNGDMVELCDLLVRAPLTQEQRRLVLRYSLGWSMTEAAQAEGLPVRTGHRRLRSAFESLKGEV